MKKWIKGLVLTLTLTTVMTVSAFAADFDHCADALKDLGLFQGGASGYELDRSATRAEAGAMLVRLLGEDAAAQKLTYSAPFTDVPEWAQPYVQYLYEKGLTAGKTETTFGTTDPCTAQMYTTFLLRALGYSDKDQGDFTYANALAFGTKVGLVDTFNCNETNFLRDHLAAMSFTALATKTATSDTNLLAQLVKSGAIKDAKGYDTMFASYAKYVALNAAAAEQTKMHMKADVTMNVKTAGVEFMSGKMSMDMLMDLNMDTYNKSKLAITGKVDATVNPAVMPKDNKISADLTYYYTDGVYYMNMMGEKVKMPMDMDAMMADLKGLSSSTAAAEPICLIKSFSEKDGVYTMSYTTGAINSFVKTIIDAMGQELAGTTMDMKMTKMDMTVTTANGVVSKQTADLGMSMTVEGQTMDMSMQMNMDVVPGDVTITLPTDLNTYKDAMAEATAENKEATPN